MSRVSPSTVTRHHSASWSRSSSAGNSTVRLWAVVIGLAYPPCLLLTTFRPGRVQPVPDVEQLLRIHNRNMIAFDLVLGSGAVFAPEATLKVLGHRRPSDDARELFRKNGLVWLTFAAAH